MPRAGLNPERVTDAAVALADEVGFDNVTVTALARQFGVADASLYSHVRSVRELRERVAVRAGRELAEVMTAAVAGRAAGAALVAFADAYRGFATAHPGLYAASNLQIAPTPDHVKIVRVTYAVVEGYGIVAEPGATDAVRLLRSTFHGFVHLEGTGGFGHPRDLDASWHRMITALDTALTHWTQA